MGFDVDVIDTSEFLLRDGSVAMTGNLELGNNNIYHVAVVKAGGFHDDGRIELYDSQMFIICGGTTLMIAESPLCDIGVGDGLSMNGCNIIGVADPRAGYPQDAATKAYVDP